MRTDSNVKLVNDLICSQKCQPGTSRSPREIARKTGISHFSVARIANKELQLTVLIVVKFSRCQHDQSRNNQRCYWPVVQMTDDVVVRSRGGHVEHHFR